MILTGTPWTFCGTAWASWPPASFTPVALVLTRWRTVESVAVASFAVAEMVVAAAETADLGVSALTSSGSDLASSVYGGGDSVPALGEVNVLDASGVSVDW